MTGCTRWEKKEDSVVQHGSMVGCHPMRCDVTSLQQRTVLYRERQRWRENRVSPSFCVEKSGVQVRTIWIAPHNIQEVVPVTRAKVRALLSVLCAVRRPSQRNTQTANFTLKYHCNGTVAGCCSAVRYVTVQYIQYASFSI